MGGTVADAQEFSSAKNRQKFAFSCPFSVENALKNCGKSLRVNGSDTTSWRRQSGARRCCFRACAAKIFRYLCVEWENNF